MIKAKLAKHYYVCDSCFESKEQDGKDVYEISIGKKIQMSSFKLCKTCLADVNKEVHDQYPNY